MKQNKTKGKHRTHTTPENSILGQLVYKRHAIEAPKFEMLEEIEKLSKQHKVRHLRIRAIPDKE